MGVLLACAGPVEAARADGDEAPPLIVASGDLWLADGGSVQGDPYDLRVQAEDPDHGGVAASGVRSVEIRAEGALLGRKEGDCTATGCTVDLDVSLDPEEYPEGKLSIEIVAEDAAGNRANDSVTVDVVRAPSAPAIAGDLVADLTATGENGDRAGSSVATIADVNGDGVPEVAVGAPSADPRNRLDAGRVYILDGTAAGDQPLVSSGAVLARIDGPAALARAGYALSNPGDVTGDGIDDLLVGSPAAPIVRGQVFVLSGAELRGDVDLAAAGNRGYRIDGPQPSVAGVLSPARKFGGSLSSQRSAAADFNGDGRDDIIIGAPSDPTGLLQPAAAYIVYGRAPGGTPTNVAALGGQGVRIEAPSGAPGSVPARRWSAT